MTAIDKYLQSLKDELDKAFTPKILQYVSFLGIQIQPNKALKAEGIEKIVREVANHLTERAEHLTNTGSEAQVAENQAIYEFGSAKKAALAIAEKRKPFLSPWVHVVAEVYMLGFAALFFIGTANALRMDYSSWRWVAAAVGLETLSAGLAMGILFYPALANFKLRIKYLVMGGVLRTVVGIFFLTQFTLANLRSESRLPFVIWEWVQLSLELLIYWACIFKYDQLQRRRSKLAEMTQ